METAKYLDMLENVKVTNHLDINDNLSFEHIIVAGQIGVESSVNNQDSKTNLNVAYEPENMLLA